ncbi:FAD-dependent oxidoreductase [Pseudohalioglobus lutimaris]|uniref:Sulfide dehydrogenase n=1 Tax=Pseudohalioglobus lutimaris TaxID=1737061 RepID=A0A2N5WZK7_9GAMM|nr:FAD/NAD(P)-binding oxidoreductase [Pseudohalioglobus lutimaris]PLW67685.1 sulfide dehydrogenase [Pseudohalioglobus lutimaris]
MTINRRNFIKATSLAAAASSAPGILRAQSGSARVVVVGGGFGGATAAKYLKHWGGDKVDVTLIDPRARHTSCVMSNLVLNGELPLKDLRFGYGDLTSKYGVQVIKDSVKRIDPTARELTLKQQVPVNYDVLVLAAGISFKKPRGWIANKNPHAWIAGGQTRLLKDQLQAMPAGGTFVMTIPRSPYRCPPGPYERACLVADMLQSNGGGRVVVLDANEGIQAEEETFSRAFDQLYGNVVEYSAGVELGVVDSNANVVETSLGDFSGDVINIIPTQRAGGLVRNNGLTDGGFWAPVDVTTYESTLAGFEDIHIIGDAQGSGQPKSAHMANAQAKICADAILRKLASQPTDHAERLQNITTNSACYSPITRDTASWLTAVFQYDMDKGAMALAHIAEAGEWTRDNYSEMFDWANNLFADVWG